MFVIRLTQWFRLTLWTHKWRFFVRWEVELGQLQIGFDLYRPTRIFIHWRQRKLIQEGFFWGYWQRVWGIWRGDDLEGEKWRGEWSFQRAGKMRGPKPEESELGLPRFRHSSISWGNRRFALNGA